jgi:tRNA pseudouridine13 synthase
LRQIANYMIPFSQSDPQVNSQRDSQANTQPQAGTRAKMAQDFPTVYPSLHLSAQFRSAPRDFIVHENLGFKPAGDGEHCLIHIEKIGQNTHWVAEQLALLLKLDKKAVGYCGRKDRHAVTRQWLSIYDPHRNIDFSDDVGNNMDIEGVQLLETTRHSHKLRPGDHQSNHFCIRLRDVKQRSPIEISSDTNSEKNSEVESYQLLDDSQKPQIISEIIQRFTSGIPNYFGSQRFGREGNNLVVAANWFENKRLPPRKQKSIIMSAARSYLFNKVLAARIEQNCWASAIDGDILINDCPTAPLWGRGRLTSQTQALELETKALEGLSVWCHGLEHCGLTQERRSTVLYPANFSVNVENDDLVIVFDLTSGAFATSILAEICTLHVLPSPAIKAPS